MRSCPPGGEIVDFAPLVVPHGHLDRLELLGEVEVEEAEAAKAHVLRRLHYGRSGGEQKRVAVYTLALSDLRIGKKVSTNIVLR